MHEHAELGVAAHWQYKEGRKVEASFQQKMVWLRQLLEPSQRDGAEPDLLAGLQAEVFEDRVFALEPQGRGRRPAQGRDAARFRLPGAHQPGPSLPRRPGQRPHGHARLQAVERRHRRDHSLQAAAPEPRLAAAAAWFPGVAAQSRQGPWLVPQAGREPEPRTGPADARTRTGPAGRAGPAVAGNPRRPGLANADALYQGLGEGDITLAQVAGAVHRRLHEHQEVQRGPRLAKPAAHGGSAGMVIDGVGDLLSSIARCCRPVPPEEILGYITIGRGVSIHRATCSNLLRLREVNPGACPDGRLGPAVGRAHVPGRHRDRCLRPARARARHLRRARGRTHQHRGDAAR